MEGTTVACEHALARATGPASWRESYTHRRRHSAAAPHPIAYTRSGSASRSARSSASRQAS